MSMIDLSKKVWQELYTREKNLFDGLIENATYLHNRGMWDDSDFEKIKKFTSGNFYFDLSAMSNDCLPSFCKEPTDFIGKLEKETWSEFQTLAAQVEDAIEQLYFEIQDTYKAKEREIKQRIDEKALQKNRDIVKIREQLSVPLFIMHRDERWDFSKSYIPTHFFVYDEYTKNGQHIPITFPLIGSHKTLYVAFNPTTEGQSNRSKHIIDLIIMRLSGWMPYTSRFCLLDPSGLGSAFPYQGKLQSTRKGGNNDVARTLESILDDIERIQTTVLSHDAPTLLDVDEDLRSGEPFEFIVAANFPHGYDRRACEALQKIANIGANTGRYVIIQWDNTAPLPHGISHKNFENLFSVTVANCELEDSEPSLEPIDSKRIDRLLNAIANGKPKEQNLEFTDLVNTTKPETWWTENASHEIRAPIGGAGGRKTDLELWFGHNREGRTCSHGMLAAATGMGKSNLYHVLIMSLATRYSPDELQFYLIDGKQGVEFQSYRGLPHAKVVCLHTSPSIARSVLSELVQEMERRNTLFKRFNVEDLIEYRKEGSPGGKVPRLLLLIDEYQTLFEDDREGYGSDLMFKLSSQGRSSGIHMLVGSQRFGAADMIKQSAIFANMHLRVGMKMSDADITSLQEYGPVGKKMLRACHQKGQAVINDGLGDDNFNKAGRVALLDRNLQKQLIEELRIRWEREKSPNDIIEPVLLDGNAQPLLSLNPQIRRLFKSYDSRPDDLQWQSFAVTPNHNNGPGADEWYPVERPAIFWVGQELNIHGHAHFILRRRANEHLLIVGDSNEALLGMTAYLCAQIAVNYAPTDFYVYATDRAISGSPWHGVIESTLNSMQMPNSFADSNEDIQNQLDELYSLLESRRNMEEDEIINEKSIFWVINCAQRFNKLTKQGINTQKDDSYDARKLLNDILEFGGELGIHLVLNFDSVRSLQKVLSRKEIEDFRHRIALQMPEEDSFSLIKSRAASKLQIGVSSPVLALYSNQMQNQPICFKPYCYKGIGEAGAAELMHDEIDILCSQVQHWNASKIEDTNSES